MSWIPRKRRRRSKHRSFFASNEKKALSEWKVPDYFSRNLWLASFDGIADAAKIILSGFDTTRIYTQKGAAVSSDQTAAEVFAEKKQIMVVMGTCL